MEERKTWLDTFADLAMELTEKTKQLSDAVAEMPRSEAILFLKRHADKTINAFRSAQSVLFKILDRENGDLELVQSLFLEMSRRFDEMQALFFVAIEDYDEKGF